MSCLAEEMCSLGMELRRNKGRVEGLEVAAMKPFYPAETSGMVHVGDTIKAFRTAGVGQEWVTTESLSPKEAEEGLQGKEGSLVRLKVVRGDAQYDCTIELVKPWVPVDPKRLPKCEPAKPLPAYREIEDKICKNFAKMNESRPPFVENRLSEMELEEMRMRQMMCDVNQKDSGIPHARRGRLVRRLSNIVT